LTCVGLTPDVAFTACFPPHLRILAHCCPLRVRSIRAYAPSSPSFFRRSLDGGVSPLNVPRWRKEVCCACPVACELPRAVARELQRFIPYCGILPFHRVIWYRAGWISLLLGGSSRGIALFVCCSSRCGHGIKHAAGNVYARAPFMLAALSLQNARHFAGDAEDGGHSLCCGCRQRNAARGIRCAAQNNNAVKHVRCHRCASRANRHIGLVGSWTLNVERKTPARAARHHARVASRICARATARYALFRVTGIRARCW